MLSFASPRLERPKGVGVRFWPGILTTDYTEYTDLKAGNRSLTTESTESTKRGRIKLEVES